MPIPYFTADQLIEIYEESGRSLDAEKLQSTALRLYPDVIGPDYKPPVFLRPGSYKGFLVDGDYHKAKFSIMSRLVNGIGIMEDGTPIPY